VKDLGLILDILKIVGIGRQQPQEQLDLRSLLTMLGQRQGSNDITDLYRMLTSKNSTFWNVGDKYRVDLNGTVITGTLISITDTEIVIDEKLINRLSITTATKGK